MAAPASLVNGSDRQDQTGVEPESKGWEQDRPFKFIAGHLCLDFTNTVGWWSEDVDREPIDRYERFTSYARLVEWSQQGEEVIDDEADELMRRAQARPRDAERVLDRALTLRQAIHWIFAASTEERAARPDDLAVLNRELHVALARLEIAPNSSGYIWLWKNDNRALDRVLWPVARSAADLLVAPDRARVKTCAGDPCGFLFLDTSVNGKRRWCIMAECGNRAKARRHYHRAHPTRVHAPQSGMVR